MTRPSWCCLVLLTIATSAVAQNRVRIEVGPVAYLVDHGAAPHDEPGRHSWFGGAVSATSGRWSLTVEGLFGNLPDTSISGRRETRQTKLALHYRPAAWVTFGPEVEALRYSADDGVALWRFLGVGFRVQTFLGTDRLEAALAGAWLPVVTAVGDDDLSAAGRVESSLTYRPRPGMGLTLAYRNELLAFAASGRDERISGLLLAASIRILGNRDSMLLR